MSGKNRTSPEKIGPLVHPDMSGKYQTSPDLIIRQVSRGGSASTLRCISSGPHAMEKQHLHIETDLQIIWQWPQWLVDTSTGGSQLVKRLMKGNGFGQVDSGSVYLNSQRIGAHKQRWHCSKTFPCLPLISKHKNGPLWFYLLHLWSKQITF